MLDPRIGRWLSVDPLAGKQPGWSSYKAMFDNPLIYVDPNGETEYKVLIFLNAKTGEAEIRMATANSIMTDGVKHRVWSLGSYSFVNDYYDYATVTLVTKNEDGSYSMSQATTIDKAVVKQSDGVYFGGNDDGHTQRETYLTGPDHGVERAFGIAMNGSGEGPIGQDFSENAAGSVDFDDLKSILKRGSIFKGYHVKTGLLASMTKAGVKDWIEFVISAQGQGELMGEVIDNIITAAGASGTEEKTDSIEVWISTE
jgi:hypothetical protein